MAKTKILFAKSIVTLSVIILIFVCMAVLGDRSSAAQEYTTNGDQYIEIPVGEKISVPGNTMDGPTRSNYYWGIKIKKYSKVTITVESPSGKEVIIREPGRNRANGASILSKYSSSNTSAPMELESGLWVFSSSSEDSYSFTVNAIEHDYGKVKVKMSDVVSGKECKFTCEVTGNPDSVITAVDDGDGRASFGSGKRKIEAYTGKLSPGIHTLKVYVEDPNVSEEWVYKYRFQVKPKAPALTKSAFTVSYNSASITAIGWGAANGDVVYICSINKNGKRTFLKGYKTSSTKGTVKVTGLKPNTSHKLCAVGYVSKGKIYGKESKAVTVRTGHASAPKVKSVKVSGAKVRKVPKRWVSGYWSGTRWITGHYTGGGYSTSYTVTVKLKRSHSGQKGIIINGKKVKGKGKTFKTTFTDYGKWKGRKTYFTICSYQNSNWLGSSKSVTKKAVVH